MTNAWPQCTIGEVCEFRGGGTPSTAKESYWKGDIPWVSPKDMKADVVIDSIDHISAEAIEESTTNLIPAGAVLVVVRSGILARTVPIAIAGRDVAINQDIKALCPDPRVTPRFLFYFLKSRLEEMLSLASRGATVHRIMADQIRTMLMPIPSRPEQQRIVGVLDKAFAGLAVAKAHAEKNLRNAHNLFDTHLERLFARERGGWTEQALGGLCEFENGDRGENYPSKNVQTTSGVPFINAGHLGVDGIDLESMNYIPRERFNLLGSGKVRAGDVLFCLRGSLGKVAIVSNVDEGAVASSLVIVRPRETLRSKYLLAYFRSTLCAREIERYRNGAAQPNLSARSLAKFKIPFGPLEEQDWFIAQVESLQAECKRLEGLYKRKLSSLDALKKSLLHRAFTGQFTARKEKALTLA